MCCSEEVDGLPWREQDITRPRGESLAGVAARKENEQVETVATPVWPLWETRPD